MKSNQKRLFFWCVALPDETKADFCQYLYQFFKHKGYNIRWYPERSDDGLHWYTGIQFLAAAAIEELSHDIATIKQARTLEQIYAGNAKTKSIVPRITVELEMHRPAHTVQLETVTPSVKR